MTYPLVLAITGASGAVYAARLLQVLTRTGHDVHLTISAAAQIVLKQELDLQVDLIFERAIISTNSRRMCCYYYVEYADELDPCDQSGTPRHVGCGRR